MTDTTKPVDMSITARLARGNPAAITEEADVVKIAQETAQVAIVGVDTTPAPAQLKPTKGEVLFEAKHPESLITTSLPNGKEVTLPYLTSKPSEIEWLREFAEHTRLVDETVGV